MHWQPVTHKGQRFALQKMGSSTAPGETRPAVEKQLGRVVIAEAFDDRGIAVLEKSGIEVVSCVGKTSEILYDALREARGLIVRSETAVNEALLAHAGQLEVVARAGVGVDAIDVDAATAAGIVVVNTPGANTIAATEQTFALLLAALRHVPQANASVHAALWQRERFVGRELHGKVLGIVGFGRIGSNVATRAAAFGMTVIATDPYIPASRAVAAGVELVELDDLLRRADAVTLHVPLTPQTRGMIGPRQLSLMREGAVLVNCARGAILDLDALLAALDSGRLSAAAIDVVPEEPPPASSASARVLQHPKVIATPHLGGSTLEALERIALELAEDVVRVLGGRPANGAVNAPRLSAAELEGAGAFVDLAFAMGTMLPQLFDDALREEITLVLQGELAHVEADAFVAALLAGALSIVSDRRVTMVNATSVASEMGLRPHVVREERRPPFRASIAIAGGPHKLLGTVLPHGARIVEIDGFELDAVAAGTMLVTRHRDVPGMVGRIGTLLGNADVNISTMQVARSDRGGTAMMVLSVDREIERGVLDEIASLPGVASARVVHV
jgi:D-3-phosphoglycerate dehydrogenase